MYKIIWIECHNPLNWGDGNYKRGIKNLKDSLPIKKLYVDPNENDGWVICECELKENSLRRAKALVEEQVGAEIFSILNKNGKVIATEEDL